MIVIIIRPNNNNNNNNNIHISVLSYVITAEVKIYQQIKFRQNNQSTVEI